MFGDIGEKYVCSYITRFFISNFYKQRQAEIGKKKASKASNTLRLKFICFLHLRYNPKIIGDILKNVQKNKCVFFSEVNSLMTMKVRLKMYDGFSIMITHIKPQLSNIWSSMYEKA